jgi:hypothetical protein
MTIDRENNNPGSDVLILCEQRRRQDVLVARLFVPALVDGHPAELARTL